MTGLMDEPTDFERTYARQAARQAALAQPRAPVDHTRIRVEMAAELKAEKAAALSRPAAEAPIFSAELDQAAERHYRRIGRANDQNDRGRKCRDGIIRRAERRAAKQEPAKAPEQSTMTNVIPYNPPAVPAPVRSRGSVLADPDRCRMNMKAAEYFAQSDLVPVHYRNKPANCFIAINRAQALGLDEFYFMEKTFVVGGRLGIAAELAIELANNSGRFRGPIQFRLFGEGDERGCTAFATLVDGTGVENTVTYQMAVADGWARNPKWKSLRDQMLQYRAGVFLARLYAAGAMGGLPMREELEDITAVQARVEAPKEPVALERPKTDVAKPAAHPLYVNLPGGGREEFPRTKAGLRQALDFMEREVAPLVMNNLPLLDMAAEKFPDLAPRISELRAAAAAALAPATDEPDAPPADFFPGDDEPEERIATAYDAETGEVVDTIAQKVRERRGSAPADTPEPGLSFPG